MSDAPSLLQQGAMVGLVLLLLGLVLWALYSRGMLRSGISRGFGSRSRQLEAIERLPLTAQHSLHLVKLEDRTLLLGVSPQSVNLLDTMPAGAVPRLVPQHPAGTAKEMAR